MCNMFANFFSLCIVTSLCHATIFSVRVHAGATEVALPQGIVERDQVFKPRKGLGKHTILLSGQTIVGERWYYDNLQLFEETLLDKTAPLSPGLDPDQFCENDSPAKDGLPDGLQRRWYKNGQLWEERPYDHGILNGPCRNWDINGNPLPTDEFKAGTGILHTFFADRRMKSECPYVLGRRHGTKRQWYSGGQLLADTCFESGIQDGWSRFYHTGGRLRQEAFYRNGKLHGIMTEWDGSGRRTDGTPMYYVDAKRVSKDEFEKSARDDRDLRRSIESIAATESP